MAMKSFDNPDALVRRVVLETYLKDVEAEGRAIMALEQYLLLLRSS